MCVLNAVMNGGLTYVQDSSWTVGTEDLEGNPLDGKALLEGSTRTSQYVITQTGDNTFTVTGVMAAHPVRDCEKIRQISHRTFRRKHVILIHLPLLPYISS